MKIKSKLAAALATGASAAVLMAAPAFAWDYGLSGSGQCQTDGSYKITWTVDNSTENEALTVNSSSNTTVVPVGTQVPANQSSNFSETESGTTPATYNLTLDVNWPSDHASHVKSANVTLSQACTQPTPPSNPPSNPPSSPPTGGRGGGEVTTTAQVTTPPTASVSAGDGSASKTTNKAAMAGLVGSLSLSVLGIGRRLITKRGL